MYIHIQNVTFTLFSYVSSKCSYQYNLTIAVALPMNIFCIAWALFCQNMCVKINPNTLLVTCENCGCRNQYKIIIFQSTIAFAGFTVFPLSAKAKRLVVFIERYEMRSLTTGVGPHGSRLPHWPLVRLYQEYFFGNMQWRRQIPVVRKYNTFYSLR
jgi:hypothetical protein